MRCAWRQVLLPQGVSHIPSCAMSLGLAAGKRAASATRACPRALSKSASTGASAEGGAILLNVSEYLKFYLFYLIKIIKKRINKIWVSSFGKERTRYSVLGDSIAF